MQCEHRKGAETSVRLILATKRGVALNNPFADVEAVQTSLLAQGYVADHSLATVLYLTLALERPLFLEGEAGVGKTELAKAMSGVLGRPLLRLQCYEGLDRQHALYDWNYPRQLLHIRVREAARTIHDGETDWMETLEDDIFGSRFLLRRALLKAIDPAGPAPVLLIDEVDRSDEEFEAFLLELLGEFQVTIPELGTIKAEEIPVVILTSNRTREVHDALKRRCLYHWLDYPDFEKEYRILTQKVPELSARVAVQVCAFVQRLREESLFKKPGVAETLHWAAALEVLGTTSLTAKRIEETIGCLLKYRDDFDWMLESAPQGRRPVECLLGDIGVT